MTVPFSNKKCRNLKQKLQFSNLCFLNVIKRKSTKTNEKMATIQFEE